MKLSEAQSRALDALKRHGQMSRRDLLMIGIKMPTVRSLAKMKLVKRVGITLPVMYRLSVSQ